MVPKLIIVCGTGRCGTWTTHKILNAQDGVGMTHEGAYLPWDIDLVKMWQYLYRLFDVLHNEENLIKIVGNASFYWLPYISEIMSNIRDPHVICLKRPREEVVESFIGYMPRINHWTARDSKHWNPNKWEDRFDSVCWPKYDLPIKDAIRVYWDEYYSTAEYWQNKFPECFSIFDMKTVLNDSISQKEMLEWAGIKNPKTFINQKLNRRGKPKGELDVHTG